MRADLTDITLVIDRSGSMGAIRDDAEGGVNALIADQAALPGDALLTLVQFDTEYEFVHRASPIRQVPRYRLVPRGSTALLDAVGRAIAETGERLAAMPEAERPGLVIFVIATDGLENSSRELTRAQVRERIEHQQTVYDWKFTFLGANQDAFAEASSIGIGALGSANYSPQRVAAALKGTSDKMGRMRAKRGRGEQVGDADNAFTEQEREDMS